MTRYSLENLTVAYAFSAIWLLKSNNQDSREKMRYMNHYFRKNFTSIHSNLAEEITHALRYEIQIRTVFSWINKRIEKEEDRKKLVNFLIDFSFVDGEVVQNELESLRFFTKSIGISLGYLEGQIEAKRKYRIDSENVQTQTVYSVNKIRSEALKTLGLTDGCSKENIKDNFRKLAKKYHPDKLNFLSKIEKTEAESCFLKIKDAYDYLMK